VANDSLAWLEAISARSRANHNNEDNMKLYKIKLTSATSERWISKYAINEKAARAMVFVGKRWQISEVV